MFASYTEETFIEWITRHKQQGHHWEPLVAKTNKGDTLGLGCVCGEVYFYDYLIEGSIYAKPNGKKNTQDDIRF